MIEQKKLLKLTKKIPKYIIVSNHIISVPKVCKPEVGIWSDEVGEMLMSRNISLVNTEDSKKITINKTIMDYTKEYVEESHLSTKILPPINYIRIYKKIYLPYELIGTNRRYEIKKMRNQLERRFVEQNFKFPSMPRPSHKSITLWRQFLEWLKTKDVLTIYDFKNKLRC